MEGEGGGGPFCSFWGAAVSEKFPLSKGTKRLLAENIDFFDSITGLTQQLGLGLRGNDAEAGTETTVRDDGNVQVTFIYPLDNNGDPADGRIYLKDQFIFDPGSKELREFQRIFDLKEAGANSGQWQAWLLRYQEGPEAGDWPLTDPKLQRFVSQVVRTHSQEITPGMKAALRGQVDYLTKVMAVAHSQNDDWSLKVGDPQAHFNLIQRPGELELTLGFPLDDNSEGADGRMFFYEKFILDGKTFELKSQDRIWKMGWEVNEGRRALHQAWENNLNAKPSLTTQEEGKKFLQALLPEILKTMPAEDSYPPAPVPSGDRYSFGKRAARVSGEENKDQKATQEGLDFLQIAWRELEAKRDSEQQGYYHQVVRWLGSGEKPDVQKAQASVQSMFAKAAASPRLAGGPFEVLKNLALSPEEALVRDRILADPLMQKVDAASREFHGLRAKQMLLLAREDLLKGEGLVESAAAVAVRLLENEKVQGNPEWKREAERILSVLTGGGSFGSRMEYLVPKFVQEVAHPSMLVAMLAAPFAGAAMESLGLAGVNALRLGRSANALGRLGASGFGLVGEAAGFTAVHRMADSLSHEPNELWNAEADAKEIGSSALLFGMMRYAHLTTGALSHYAARGKLGSWAVKQDSALFFHSYPTGRILETAMLRELSPAAKRIQFLLNHGGGVGAMYFAGKVGRQVGLQEKPRAAEDHPLFDAGLMYGQAMLGFNLANRATAGRVAGEVAELRLRLKEYRPEKPPDSKPPDSTPPDSKPPSGPPSEPPPSDSKPPSGPPSEPPPPGSESPPPSPSEPPPPVDDRPTSPGPAPGSPTTGSITPPSGSRPPGPVLPFQPPSRSQPPAAGGPPASPPPPSGPPPPPASPPPPPGGSGRSYQSFNGVRAAAIRAKYPMLQARLYGEDVGGRVSQALANLYGNIPELEAEFNPVLLANSLTAEAQRGLFTGLRDRLREKMTGAEPEAWELASQDYMRLIEARRPYLEATPGQVQAVLDQYRPELRLLFGNRASRGAKLFADLFRNTNGLEAELNPLRVSETQVHEVMRLYEIASRLQPRTLTEENIFARSWEDASSAHSLLQAQLPRRYAEGWGVGQYRKNDVRAWELAPGRFYVGGRGEGSDILLESHLVSNQHFKIRGSFQTWYIEDTGSSNGTFLNGNKMRHFDPVDLRHGSEIDLGPHLLRFELGPDGNALLVENRSPDGSAPAGPGGDSGPPAGPGPKTTMKAAPPPPAIVPESYRKTLLGESSSEWEAKYRPALLDLYGSPQAATAAQAYFFRLMENFPGLETECHPQQLAEAKTLAEQKAIFDKMDKIMAENPRIKDEEFKSRALLDFKSLKDLQQIPKGADSSVVSAVLTHYRLELQALFGPSSSQAAKLFAELYKNFPDLEESFNPQWIIKQSPADLEKYFHTTAKAKFHPDRQLYQMKGIAEFATRRIVSIKEHMDAEKSRLKAASPMEVYSQNLNSWELKGEQATYAIGRDTDGDVVLSDPSVSTLHCSISFNPKENQWHVQDLGSTNGTFVNGMMIKSRGRVKLQHGNVITVGKQFLLFNINGDGAELRLASSVEAAAAAKPSDPPAPSTKRQPEGMPWFENQTLNFNSGRLIQIREEVGEEAPGYIRYELNPGTDWYRHILFIPKVKQGLFERVFTTLPRDLAEIHRFPTGKSYLISQIPITLIRPGLPDFLLKPKVSAQLESGYQIKIGDFIFNFKE